MCLLVDIQLGGMSGLEMRRQLLAEGDRTRVIFVTARDEPAVREEASLCGCEGFFRKTDPGSSIIEVLHRIASANGADWDVTPVRLRTECW